MTATLQRPQVRIGEAGLAPLIVTRSVRRRSPFVAVAIALLGWALAQNLVRLSVPPVEIDEPGYAAMGWRYLHWASLSPGEQARSNFEHPPLAKLLFGLADLVAGHASITASRAVCAACTVLTGIVLACWLGRAAGRWVGLLAGAMVALLPMIIAPQSTSFGRSAYLDPVAELFMVCSLALAWAWFHRGGRQGWWLAVATGAVTGLAAASKANGFLGVVGVIVLGLVWAHGGARGVRMVQAVLAAVASAIVFVACYLPVGDPSGRIPYLVRFQLGQSEHGHLIYSAGRLSTHPAWWANLWFAWHSLGPWLGTALLSTAVVAVAVRRDRVVAWCLAALAGPSVFHCFIAGNALPFYWVMWMPALFALSALGVRELTDRATWADQRPARAALMAGCAAALAILLVASITESARVLTAAPVGASHVSAIRSTLDLHGEVLAAGTYAGEINPYLAGVTPLSTLPRDLRHVDTVLMGQPRCRILVDPGIRALVQTNLALGTLREAHSDRMLRIYVATGPLHAPTPAEIASQPVSHLTDHC